MTVQDFTGCLEVTATAVRQRLDRLVEVRLIERRKESVGRGRPQFRYSLTSLGMSYSSVSYADLAAALWAEVMELPNASVRSGIMRRVARRMSQAFAESVVLEGSLQDRMQAMAVELVKRKIPTAVSPEGALPILQMLACPFPNLASDENNRQVCEMEQEMISAAVGQAVELDCCRLDGHEHCQFRPINTPPALANIPSRSV